jgi:anti-sigma regulatory factor (Ser/Thr protein kinase)
MDGGTCLAGPAAAGTNCEAATLPGVPQSAGAARALASAAMAGTACPAAGDVLQVIGELVQNVVRHSRSRLPGGEFTVALTVTPGESVLIEVQDQGPAPGPAAHVPRPRPGEPRESGMGLLLVAAVSESWGRDGRGLYWARVNWAS